MAPAFRILVIGEPETGKTSIVNRYAGHKFYHHLMATIGVEFVMKYLNWDADTIVKLAIWDTAGCKGYRSVARKYYEGAVGFMVVFDVTRPSSLEAVKEWKADLDNTVTLADGSPVPCVLLANKCDRAKEGLVRNESQMNKFGKENGFVGWFETSAKDDINIDDAFRFLVTWILQNDEAIRKNTEEPEKVKMDKKKDKIKMKC